MSHPRFVHLHLHSEFSLVDGIVRIPKLIARCKELAMPAVALTDQSNVFALPKFYRAGLSAGIKPVAGAELWVADGAGGGDPYRIVVLCQHLHGYRNLSNLLTRAYREGQRGGIAIVDETWLDALSTVGLIVLSGGIHGDLGALAANGRTDQIRDRVRYWQDLLDDRYFVELTRCGREREERYLDTVLSAIDGHGVAIVASNDVRFLESAEFEAHEARVCIHHGRALADPRRPRDYSSQQYLRSEEEMCELFADLPAALENSVNIAIRCNLEMTFGEYHLPEYPVSDSEQVEVVLQEKARKGFERRVQSAAIRRDTSLAEVRENYAHRLDTELEVISNMGFAGYFLIVADFIEWAKQHQIPVGPGRGSGAGSLVAFALGITELDPLEYDLLFERFLNPERVSMPDFDVDFCMDRRDEVIDYVAARYGRDRVAQIITHGTMAAKAVLRDVGRVLGFPYGFVDQLAKLVPFDPQMTLTRALAEEPVLAKRYADEEDVRNIIDLALRLEGLARNAGRHAGGVVIAPSPLTDFMPLYCEQGGEGFVTQFDMGDVEAIGLVKFDFLGLRTLTIIDWAVRDINLVRSEQAEPTLDILHLPLDDAATFTLVQSGRTTAVFQLESRGMKDLIKRLKPDSFEDLIALVALYRPGPLQSGMVDDYIERKHGKAVVKYPHPALEPILKPTYGVILYQEQVMQIARVLAGYTLGAADLLRRAMGKKKADEMAKQREIFVSGAGANGIVEADASYIFDLMEKFAGYGFNKSHSAAYALVAYQTAWLKARYPAAFMAAVLSADMDSTDKVVRLIEECRLLGLAVVAPGINQCGFRFSVADESTIRYGLGAVKGVGESVISALVAERECNGHYADLVDLCRRNAGRKINRRALEALIKAGAFDCLGASRANLSAALDRVLQMTEQHVKAEVSGQSDFFGLAPSTAVADANPAFEISLGGDVREWSQEELLAGEKETLGLYLSGHPIERYRDELGAFSSCTLAELKTGRKRVAGLIMAVRVIKTRRGRFAVVTLDDKTARIDVTIYRDLFETHMDKLVADQIVVVEGACDIDEYSGDYSIQVEEIMTLDEARNRLARSVVLDVTESELGNGFIGNLQDVITSHTNGHCPVAIEYARCDSRARLRLGEAWRVQINDKLLDGLRRHLGEQRVHVEY
ncbi:MAG: DNA polymerase III subunit alpha [Gammaproteobacteria bacterium]